MRTLKDLVKTLKIGTILIIENEFEGSRKASHIIGHYLKVGDARRCRIQSLMTSEGFSTICEALEKFWNAYSKSYRPEHHDSATNLLPFESEMLLQEIDEGLLPNFQSLVEVIDAELNGQKSDIFQKTCLKCGFFGTLLLNYEKIIEEIESLGDVHISIFKRIPVEDDLNLSLIGEDSRFCIAIVDKIVDGDSNAGKQFINDTLIRYNDDNPGKMKVLSILFTSNPAATSPCSSLHDYFRQELGKTDPDPLSSIANILTNAAFATSFESLHRSFKYGTTKALELVLASPKNIKEVLQKSNTEGLSPFESIKYWFELAQKYFAEKMEMTDLRFVAGLSKLFENEHLRDSPQTGYSIELDELRTFDVFDTTINDRHLPIQPGDIFQKGGKTYLLMGQVCDTMIRQKENLRKSTLAELLECNICETTIGMLNNPKFFEAKPGVIEIQHFPNELQMAQTLQLPLTKMESLSYGDFRILDLCMFDPEGKCRIDLLAPLNASIENLLPANKGEYYKSLQTGFSPFLKLPVDFLWQDNLSISPYPAKKEESTLDFEVQRIARIRKSYYDSIFQKHMAHRGRIDLNLLDVAREISTKVKIKYRFGNEDPANATLVESQKWTRGNQHHFKNRDLIEVIPELENLLLNIGLELPLDGNNFFTVEHDDSGEEDSYFVTFFPIVVRGNAKAAPLRDHVKISMASLKEITKIRTLTQEACRWHHDNSELVISPSEPLSSLHQGLVIHAEAQRVRVTFDKGLIKVENIDD